MKATELEHGLLKPRVAARQHPKVKALDVLAFFQQLSTLFRAGTPIYEGLSIASGQSQSSKLGDIVKEVAEKVAAGAAFHEALRGHPRHFKLEWAEIIRSGEESGELGQVLDRLSAQIDAQVQLRAKITSAMMYPAILLVVAVLAVAVMLVKVVPTFQSMFQQMEQELPAITQFVIDLSAFLQAQGWKLVVGVVATVVALQRWARTARGALVRDRLLVGLPLVGDLTVQMYMQKFANNLTISLRAGLPLLGAVHSLRGIFGGNAVYARSLDHVADLVGQGERFADALEATGAFTTFVVRMTRIGEQSGTLPDVMAEVDQYYRRRVETVLARLTGSIETVVILFMGLAVAGILCAIYLPMFSMASGVQ